METAHSLRPDCHQWDPAPNQLHRPGVLWAINAPNATIRVWLFGSTTRDYTVLLSSLENAGIGSPLVAKFTSEAYTSPTVLPGAWGGGAGPGGGTAEADAVTNGQFHLGIIPRAITGAPRNWDI